MKNHKMMTMDEIELLRSTIDMPNIPTGTTVTERTPWTDHMGKWMCYRALGRFSPSLMDFAINLSCLVGK